MYTITRPIIEEDIQVSFDTGHPNCNLSILKTILVFLFAQDALVHSGMDLCTKKE